MARKQQLSKAEYRAASYQMLRVIGAYLNGNAESTNEQDINAEILYYVSKKNGLCALTAAALAKCGIHDEAFTVALAKSQRKSLLFDRELQLLSEAFDAEKIRFLPLKGMVLKSLYPGAGTREMSDIDILIDEDNAEAVRKSMTDSGYDTIEFCESNQDVYHKPPFFGVEIHRALFDKRLNARQARYYAQKDLIESANAENGTEDIYIYLIAHAYKHYSYYGTGLRTLVDINLYLKKYQRKMDFQYIDIEAQKLGISEFEQMIRPLSEKLFSVDAMSEREKEELEVFVFAGLYGSIDHYVKQRFIRKTDGHKHKRLVYIAKRLQVTDQQITDSRFCSKHPSLAGLMVVARPVKALATKPGIVVKEIKEILQYKKSKNDKN